MRRVHSASVGLARAQEDLHKGDEQRQRERTQAKVPRRVGAWARVRWAVDTETEDGRESDTRARAQSCQKRVAPRSCGETEGAPRYRESLNGIATRSPIYLCPLPSVSLTPPHLTP